jgi:hypothetical protein
LEECQILLSLQETNLERQEKKLVEEQAWGLYSSNGQDLSVELEELREHVAGVEGEHGIEAMKLSQLVLEISDSLVDLGVFPIWDVLTVAGLVLEHPR